MKLWKIKPTRYLAHFWSVIRQTGLVLDILAAYRIGIDKDAKNKETVLAGRVFGNIEIIESELAFVVRFDRLFELNPNGEKVSYLPYAVSDGPSNMTLVRGSTGVQSVKLRLGPT